MLLRIIFTFLLFTHLIESHENMISIEELDYWDKAANELMQKTPPKGDAAQVRLFAYLYNAQKAFADASQNKGTLNSISLHILKLFFPDYENKNIQSDSRSEELSQRLSAQFNARYKEEQSQIHPAVLLEGAQYWHGTVPYKGITISSMKPWTFAQASDFRSTPPPPPGSPAWQEELNKVKKMMEQATADQKKQILYWDGKAYPGSGDFQVIAVNFMKERKIPLEKQIQVRASLATAIMDSMIAVFDSKYTYLVKRPDMLDPSIKTIIPTPNHPSYPAAHSSTAGAAAAILSYYFPENSEQWNKLKEECGLSRIWAGIHFPIDMSSGNELGNRVAENVLKKEKK